MQPALMRMSGALLLSAGLVLGACGEDESEAKDGADAGHEPEDGHAHEDGDDTEHGDAGAEDAAVPREPARYVIATQVFSGENSNTYLVATDTIEAGEVSLDDATVVPGRAIVASPGSGRYVYVGGDKGPQLTRYELSADGALVAGEQVSFGAKGVASIGEYQTQFQFVSDTKAYYFDAKSSQAVVWNPSTMKLISSIDLSELASATHVVAFSSAPARRGDEVIMPVGFRSLNNAQIVDGAALVIIDSNEDKLTIARDDRCGYVRDAVTTEDGTIYVATEAYGAAVHRLNKANAPAPCLLRVLPGKRAFDPDFHVDLATLSGGKTVGSLALLPSGKAYTKVLDESLTSIGPMTNARGLASAAAWTWSEITLGDEPTLAPAPELPASAGSIIAFRTDDAVLFAEFVNFSESTKLRNLSDGSGDVLVSAQGLLFSLAQLR
jgi:hypothetical protein